MEAKKEPQATGRSRLLNIIVAVVAAFLLLYILTQYGPGEAAIFGLIVLVALLVAPLYTLGYLLAGWLVALHLSQLHFGPLMIVHQADHYETSFAVRWRFMAAFVANRVDQPNLHRRLAIYYLGGPLSLLLIGGLGLALCFGLIASNSGLITSVLLAGSVSYLAVGLMFLRSTWRVVRPILRHEPAGEALVGVSRLVAATGDLRPRDWPADLVKQAGVLHDGSPTAYSGAAFNYYYALDSGDYAAAANALCEVLAASAKLNVTHQMLRHYEAAIFAAAQPQLYPAADHLTTAHRVVATNSQFRDIWDRPDYIAIRLHAEAATLLAEGRTDLAGEAADEALRLLSGRKDGINQMRRDQLQQIVKASVVG